MLLDFPQIFRKYNLDISGIIHIGAHYGSEVKDYINHGIQEIVLFEPLSMYLSDNDAQSSSILKPKKHIEEMPWIHFNGTEEVEVHTLDSYDLNGYNFINIDVQGYELEVFKGSVKTLEKIDYIYSEVNKAELYEGCAQMDELDNFLGEYGFKRVETYWPETWYNWGDAFYIKEK
jgi:hypothetical protein